ncbi:MAG TPA: hypothetical protein VHD90_26665 [Phototrophicaceae bacterium]|nr:hypothetical protein [Phototrophicaceae bacterium]
MNSLPPPRNSNGMKTQVYIIGAAAGILFGLLSAYMYNRAATDYGPSDGQNRVQTGEVLGLGLALLGIIRQVTEMGRGPQPKRGRR